MPRPARPWFRFYSESLTSRKAQKLKPPMFKHWVNLLCLANVQPERGSLPFMPDIAYALRLTEEVTADIIQELVTLLFIDVVSDGFVMHDWEEWQKDRDVAPAQRTGKRDVSVINITETPRIRERNRDVSVTRVEESREDKERELEPEEDHGTVPVVRAFERCFGRMLSPMEIESIKALDEEHPRDRIDYALRESAELGKRSVRYIQTICENQAQSGDDHERKPMGRNTAPTQALGDAAAIYASFGIHREDLPVRLPVGGREVGGVATLDDSHDP